MFAVIRRYTAHEGTTERIVKAVNEGFAPQVRQLPGFVAYYLMDAGDDTIASVSVFASRASAEESTRLASEWVRRNIASMIRTSPVILTGEVRSHAMIDGGSNSDAPIARGGHSMSPREDQPTPRAG